jgi:hypothetical protein
VLCEKLTKTFSPGKKIKNLGKRPRQSRLFCHSHPISTKADTTPTQRSDKTMSSLSRVKNLVKKHDPPEMMDGGSTSKISSHATSRKRLGDPPEMMNGRLPSPKRKRWAKAPKSHHSWGNNRVFSGSDHDDDEEEDERYHSDNILFGGVDISLFGGFSPPSLASDMHDTGASDHETSTPITPQKNDILMGRGGTSILSL